jgi:hypothetical protein
MKQILVLFIAIVTFCSCEKRYNYECIIYKSGFQIGQSIYGDKINKTCTEKQIERFIKRNAIDQDGDIHTYQDGDVIVECTKK